MVRKLIECMVLGSIVDSGYGTINGLPQYRLDHLSCDSVSTFSLAVLTNRCFFIVASQPL